MRELTLVLTDTGNEKKKEKGKSYQLDLKLLTWEMISCSIYATHSYEEGILYIQHMHHFSQCENQSQLL